MLEKRKKWPNMMNLENHSNGHNANNKNLISISLIQSYQILFSIYSNEIYSILIFFFSFFFLFSCSKDRSEKKICISFTKNVFVLCHPWCGEWHMNSIFNSQFRMVSIIIIFACVHHRYTSLQCRLAGTKAATTTTEYCLTKCFQQLCFPKHGN